MTVSRLPGSKSTSKSRVYVAYLGPVGTYSHEVTRKRFDGPEYALIPYGTIRDAVHALIPSPGHTRALLAVVPIENSYFGPVVETREVLSEPQVIRHTRTLDDRIRFKVEHCLIARKPSMPPKSIPSPSPEVHPSIRIIYSHAQALGQCRNYIALHYPHAQTEATSSTAEAAILVANDVSRSSLAICSAACVEYLPELEVLDFNIQDAGQENLTTFIVLESKD